MDKGRLLILNGGSSAGKTSLGKALQDRLPGCWMLLGIDAFWMALPPEQLNLSHVQPEFYSWRSELEADGKEYFVVVPGPLLDRAMYARYRAILAYLDAGLDVVADDVVWKQEWLAYATRVFDGYRVWFAGVHVSDEEGARREVQRGDRHGGWNRGSARAAHRNALGLYDFEIDTTDRPPHVLAREVEARLAACPEPRAFARLRDELREVEVGVAGA
jgi:chloramphenicol 3-O phosphotransferase